VVVIYQEVLLKVSCALLSICFVVTWNLDPLFQLVLGSREHCWGQETSSNQEIFLCWKKKCKNCAVDWVTDLEWSILKLCGIGWGAANKSQQDEEKWDSLKTHFCVPFVELTVLFWGCWASTESLNLNDCRDRGVHTSAPPLSRNQRRKCPWMKHGPQTRLAAAREDTRSAGIVSCVTGPFCWAGGHVVCLGDSFVIWVSEAMTCCCHFNISTYFGMACQRSNLELWILSHPCVLFKHPRKWLELK